MSRTALVERLAETLQIPKVRAELGVRALAALIEERLFREGEFTVSGVGRLARRRIPARRHRNPRTGEPLVIPPRVRLVFYASPRLRARLTHSRTGDPEP